MKQSIKYKTEAELDSMNLDNYLDYYDFDSFSNNHRAIMSLYYTFTTLSTVGFGDLAPRSNTERLVCSFILMFGVSIFSYFMGNFIEILAKYNSLNQDLDDADNLARFFGVITYFNDGMEINGDPDERVPLKKRIEDHFNYKWNND